MNTIAKPKTYLRWQKSVGLVEREYMDHEEFSALDAPHMDPVECYQHKARAIVLLPNAGAKECDQPQ